MLATIKTPELFAAADGGGTLSKAKATSTAYQKKQLPADADEEQLNKGAKEAQNSVTAVVVLQLVAQAALKARHEELFGFVFAMQLVQSLSALGLDVPANSVIFLGEFRKLIRLELLNPRGLISLWKPGWSYGELFGAKSTTVVSKDQEVSVVEGLEIYLVLLGFLLVFLALMGIGMLVIKFRERIREALEALWTKTFWNNTIRSILLAYLDLCLSAAGQLRLWLKDSDFLAATEGATALALGVVSLGFLAWTIYFLKSKTTDEL